jgi:hypothetical protein
MSLEAYVFLNRATLPTAAVWGTAIHDHGFAVFFDADFDPLKDTGFVPCRCAGFEAGFEYYLHSRDAVASAYPVLKPLIDGYDSAVSFVWSGQPADCATAIAAAAVLTSLSSGLMYDPQDDVRMSGPEAVDYARCTIVELMK